MSPENLAQLFRESHFTSATANMTPLAKAYLRTYLNNATNLQVLSAFVERVLVVAQTAQDRKLAQTTLGDSDMVQGQQTGQNTFPPKPMIGWFPSQG